LAILSTSPYDLADPFPAVFVDYVVDYLFAAVLAEVHVDIRHGDTFRVEETLEQQVVGEGVQIGDADGVGHQRTGGRAPARSNRDTLVFGPVDEVGHDQEVGREFHLPNTLQFYVQTVEIGLLALQRHVGILGQDGVHPVFQPLNGQCFQHVVVILAGRRVEMGEVVITRIQRQLQVATVGNG